MTTNDDIDMILAALARLDYVAMQHIGRKNQAVMESTRLVSDKAKAALGRLRHLLSTRTPASDDNEYTGVGV